MVTPTAIWKILKENDFRFFSGVPCSILGNLLQSGFGDPEIEYIPAVRENAALGIASGARLAGRKSGILIQNSGLGNIINALTSFNLIYRVPVLMFITWRGYQGKDAPEHSIMGEKTVTILEDLGIPTVVLSENYINEISDAVRLMEEMSIPAAIIVKKGIIQ
ncbi:thiamine pyrophosphate-binding protein [Candidatus Omnitrophota bacterium]